MTHFSEFIVFSEWGVYAAANVSPRSIKVGETLDASLSITSDGGGETTIEAAADYIATSNPADLVFVTENLTDFHALPPVTIPADVAGASASSLQTWKCVRTHTGVMRVDIQVTILLPIFDSEGNVSGAAPVTVSRLEPFELDYVCEEDTTSPPDGIKTGVFTLPFGMTASGYVHVVDGPFANLSGSGPFVSIGGDNGAVIIDLVTGLSALNMTPAGSDGRLGAGVLNGVLPVSSPGPGPTTDAALFATGASGGATRPYLDTGGGTYGWGFTAAALNTVLQASPAGGSYVTTEVVTVEPRIGLNIWDRPALRFWGYASTLPASAFRDTPLSGAVPKPGGPVLTLSGSTGPGAKSTLALHDRSASPAEPLFEWSGGTVQRMACAPLEAGNPSGRHLCGATELTGSFHYWVHDPANPTATPTVTTRPTGLGSFGIHFARLADGYLGAAVTNVDDRTVSVFRFDDSGKAAGEVTVNLPPGIVALEAALAKRGAHDYLVGSVANSAKYFGLDFRF